MWLLFSFLGRRENKLGQCLFILYQSHGLCRDNFKMMGISTPLNEAQFVRNSGDSTRSSEAVQAIGVIKDRNAMRSSQEPRQGIESYLVQLRRDAIAASVEFARRRIQLCFLAIIYACRSSRRLSSITLICFCKSATASLC